MLQKRTLLLAKSEVTYGVDPTPSVAANAIEAIDVEVKEVSEAAERPLQLMYLGRKKSVLGKQHVEISFKVEIRGSGSVNVAPRLSDLLLACKMDETIVSGTSITYEPISTSQPSVTLWVNKDGRYHKINGCVGNLKIVCAAGEIGLLEFSFKGIYAAPVNGALSAPTYESTIPPACKSCSFTYNSETTLVARSIELDMGNTIAMREDLSAATGVKGFEITDRNPTMKFDVECQIIASYTFRTDMLSTERQVSWVVGSVSDNIATITVPKFNITDIAYGDADGLLLESVTGDCDQNSGDDDFSIALT